MVKVENRSVEQENPRKAVQSATFSMGIVGWKPIIPDSMMSVALGANNALAKAPEISSCHYVRRSL